MYRVPDLPKKVNLSHFKIQKVIGKGGFSKVYQVVKNDTGRVYAMKVVNKDNLKHEAYIQQIMAERSVLMNTNHPFIVKLYYVFENSNAINFVL